MITSPSPHNYYGWLSLVYFVYVSFWSVYLFVFNRFLVLGGFSDMTFSFLLLRILFSTFYLINAISQKFRNRENLCYYKTGLESIISRKVPWELATLQAPLAVHKIWL